MSAFSFDALTKTGEIYLFFTRHSGYILQVRWIHFIIIWYDIDSEYQKLLKSVRFSLSYFLKIKMSSLFWNTEGIAHLDYHF